MKQEDTHGDHNHLDVPLQSYAPTYLKNIGLSSFTL